MADQLLKDALKSLILKKKNKPIKKEIIDKLIQRFEKIRDSKGNISVSKLRLEMQHTMQNYCPVYRSGEVMTKGKSLLLKILKSLDNIKISDKSLIWNTEIVEALELHNLIIQALASIESALKRTESRGAHSRIDYKLRNDKSWLKHNLVWTKNNGVSKFDFRSVQLRTKNEEIGTIAPKARVY